MKRDPQFHVEIRDVAAGLWVWLGVFRKVTPIGLEDIPPGIRFSDFRRVSVQRHGIVAVSRANAAMPEHKVDLSDTLSLPAIDEE